MKRKIGDTSMSHQIDEFSKAFVNKSKLTKDRGSKEYLHHKLQEDAGINRSGRIRTEDMLQPRRSQHNLCRSEYS